MSLHIRGALEQAYRQNLKTKGIQVLAVSCDNQLDICRDFDILCSQKGIDKPVRIQLTPEDYFAPLSPVLYLINELLGRIGKKYTDVPEILNLGKYESIMLNSMLQNRFNIKEYNMPADIEYLKLRIKMHIRTLLCHLLSGSEPLPVCIRDLQYAGPSSIKFLIDILAPKSMDSTYKYFLPGQAPTPKRGNGARTNMFSAYSGDNAETALRDDPSCVLVLCFDPARLPRSTTASRWLEAEDEFEHFFTLMRPSDTEPALNYTGDWPVQDYQARPMDTFEEAVQRCEILFNYLCYTEVIEIANSLIQRIQFGKERKYKNEELIYQILGRAHLYNAEYEDALIAFDLMYEKAQRNNNTDDACNSYIEIAYTHIFRSDFESALHFAELAAHLGETSRNMRLVAISNFCLFVAYDRAGIKFGHNNISTLVTNLERYDLIKEEVYVLRNSFAQALLDPQNLTMDDALKMCEKALTLANRAGIKHEIAAANHCKGVVFSNLNQFQDALIAYRHSESMYSEIQVPAELTHVYNSIGFVLNETEDYPKAHEYFLKALRNSIHLNDYTEITITIYNIAQLYLQCGLLNECLDTLDILLEIMSVLRTRRMPFHSINHIYLTKALAYTYTGQIGLAEQMMRRCANISNEVPIQEDERFLFDLVQIIILTENKRKDKALEQFARLRKAQQLGKFTPKQNILFYVTAINIFWRHYRDGEETFRYLKEGYAYAVRNKLLSSQRQVANCWRNDYQPYDRYDIIQVPLNELNQIIQLVQQQKKVNILWQQVHEMRLISLLHNFSLSVESKEQLAAETLRLLSSHFNINGGMIYSTYEGNISLIYELNSSKTRPTFSFRKIGDFINEHVNGEFQEYTDIKIGVDIVHRVVIYPLIYRTEVFGQMLLFCFDKPHKTQNNEDNEAITMISQQLSTQLIMIMQREQLRRVSTTDMLTGLYNRGEFNRILTDIISEIAPNDRLSLGFIDLDNFKYYNDNLGHDIGDKLLIWFAELLNSFCGPDDLICRWGGDEFLFLMKHCGADEAETRMQRVLDSLNARKGYKKEIEEFMGKEVNNLPERYYLSCSIGIMDNSKLPQPFTESDLLTHADAALYEVKRTGKGKVLNFEKMTHEADDVIMESNR